MLTQFRAVIKRWLRSVIQNVCKAFLLSITDTDDYARVALPTGDAMEVSESNGGETSDAESGAESDDHHVDAMSVGSAEII